MQKKEDDFLDVAAERAILAGVCTYGGDAFVDVDDLIDANSFRAHPLHPVLYKSLERHFSKGLDRKVDVPSIISASRSLGLDGIVNTPQSLEHLRGIFNYPIQKETVRHQAQKLFKLRMTGEIDNILAKIRRDLRTVKGDESFNEITGFVENPIFEFVSRLNEAGGEGPTHIATGVDEFLDQLEANPRDNIGISSGYAKYDFYIGGGFRRGTVSVLGARMKVGKTIFCDNIALHVAGELKIPVLNLDTEMNREEHLARILAYVAGVKYDVEVTIREVETGYYAKDEYKRQAVRKAAQWLKTIPYEYDSVVGRSFEEQVAIMRRWVRRRVGYDDAGRTKDCLVIYDYLQPPEPGEFSEHYREYQVLGYQMLSLLKTAAKYDIPIFTLVQLNRDGIDRESTGVAADSDRVLRKAANFSIFKWKSDDDLGEDGRENGTHKLVIIIARHGEAMERGDYINMKFDGKTARIVEMKTHSEILQERKYAKPKGCEIEDERDVREGGDSDGTGEATAGRPVRRTSSKAKKAGKKVRG